MIRALSASLALLALAGCTNDDAAGTMDTGASALADIEVVTSPGGITAWLVSESFVPIIAMEMSWRGGAALEPKGKDGAGWVLGYMGNEGAGDLDSTDYGMRMEDLSMEFGCNVGIDWTRCAFSTLTETADESFEMLQLGLGEPRFDQEPIDRAKRELSVNLERGETDPRTLGWREMNTLTSPGHAYARYATPETAASVTREDVMALGKGIMTRDRLLVVVVGDITAEELKPRLDQVFGGLPATSDLPELTDVAPVEAPPAPVVIELPIPQTMVLFSGAGPKRSDPDFFAAYVLNYILGGGGFSSRLVDEIREQRGLTYGIGTNLDLRTHMWRWTGATSTMNDKADEVVQLIKDNIARLGAEGPSQKEMEDAKAYLTGAFPLSFDSNMKIAAVLMGFQQDGLGIDYVGKRNDLVNAVTLDDLKRVAATYMKPENFTFVLVGQPK